MQTFPIQTTPRLRLRLMREDDFPNLLRYVNHEAVFANILNFPEPYLESDAQNRLEFVTQGFQRGERYVFAMASREDDGFIGEIGIHLDKNHHRAEMGFWLGEPYWNRGLMREAVAAVLKFGFEEAKLHKIIATHYLSNPASGKVLLSNGMVKEAEMKDHYFHQGEYRSIAQYRMLRDEFAKLSSH